MQMEVIKIPEGKKSWISSVKKKFDMTRLGLMFVIFFVMTIWCFVVGAMTRDNLSLPKSEIATNQANLGKNY
jgi:hypothetical protein